VKDVEMLVRVSGEQTERLVLGAQDIQPGKVGGEDQRGSVGEDQHKRELPCDSYHGVNDVYAEESEDEDSGGILWKRLVEEQYRTRLVSEERP
jgi:hypothetical protein